MEMSHTVRVNAFDGKAGRPQWCRENVGVEREDWDYTSVNATILEYIFLREEDAIMFALKWL